MSMKNFNGTVGNRTRDLPACSAVPRFMVYAYLKVLLLVRMLKKITLFRILLQLSYKKFSVSYCCFYLKKLLKIALWS